ncbi:MAG: peptidoglycan-associated lipoprotein Pal [Acidobacteria bacterium]|nr:MAG: peptidoglycan-associated lipoprotein Pal [Acidobacteriota bacterium]
MIRLARAWLFLAVAAALAAGCGGKKRPPAVATAPPPSSAPSGRSQPTEVPPPVETGPDVRAVDTEAARGEDFTVSNPETGEGGPLEDIRFEYDSANLTDHARSILEKHALWLQNHRPAKVLVEGHCDERGTVEYNLALGEKRARAARDYLASLGVSTDRLRTVSYGKERPLDAASNEAAWAANRRDHFAVSR